MFLGFGILWLTLAILIWQDTRNDKMLQELKKRKKERKREKKRYKLKRKDD